MLRGFAPHAFGARRHAGGSSPRPPAVFIDKRSLGERHQSVAFLSCAEFDRRGKLACIDHQARIGQRCVIKLGAVFGDQAFGVFAGLREAGADDELHDRDAICNFVFGQRKRGQVIADAAFFKDLAGGGLGCGGSLGPVGKSGDFVGKTDFGFVDLGAFERAQAVAFLDRQLCVELEEAAHIGVRGVAPELPELIR